ncbi:MAG: site-specific integrase [Lachnospiraceae bacterium]|nr:site-specific integrase [Lachnospiraceae bacterium]
MKLLQYLYEEMDIYKLEIIICISTGLRLGEICALKWNDIDLQGGLLHVNTTVQRIAMNGYNTRTILLEGEPKSIFSKREIPLSDEITKLLFSYHNVGETYVINRNKPMEPRTYQNKFQKYLRLADIQKKNFHSLRHTFATNCISSGMDIKSLSEILGHSDVRITLDRYIHPTVETKRYHMNSLSEIYGQYMGRQSK